MSEQEYVQYLSVLALLSKEIGALAPPDTDDGEEDDGDDDDDAPDPLEAADEVVLESLRLLNAEASVTRFVALAEGNGSGGNNDAGEETVLRNLCSVCHNLLLCCEGGGAGRGYSGGLGSASAAAGGRAVHRFRLLNAMAFRPTLLQRLWTLVIGTRQNDGYGTQDTLLEVINPIF